ncbi:heavy-metal-associated domain-containing protein [Spirochaetota bacterium]
MAITATEKIGVQGMTCMGCARILESELRKFEDIKFTINVLDKYITVNYPADKYSRKDFEKAIESHGYTIEKISD